ncbi:hypothetical protein [Streptomyces poonensis]|uniref:Uncharacterized protein n=1 Tax=Streptomyces poonensis TaxID=68255 RepID=A0A918UEC7_9ACTN|nr:hypothetical protein [Streptomyces poonensis]GGY96212.1 hypothetical protein GCM10010365_13920 [Streptomyces poonensis]GLJ88923.1 hypothetical protein GCM10017589_15230 [Streptomyces poonensis]
MRVRLAEACEFVLLVLLRALLPARGRHRSVVVPAQSPACSPPVRPQATHDAQPREWDTPLVRPYLLTPDERRERKLQRRRRQALWLATHGIDVGPRHIHGMEVSA